MTERKATQLTVSDAVVFNLWVRGAGERGARWLWGFVLVLWLLTMGF